jgi:hypothetical protein
MTRRQKYLSALSEIVPAGLLGVSVLLGSAAPSSAKEHPAGLQGSSSDSVSERLAAIREAVSALAGELGPADPADHFQRLAWGNWWRNGGWYRPWRWGWPNWPNWRNWPNWNNWWRNW